MSELILLFGFAWVLVEKMLRIGLNIDLKSLVEYE